MASETVIGRTIVIDGEVKSSEDISVQGTVKGRISTTADLYVESSGTVEAEVQTRSIEIHGKIVGNVSASDKYELMRDGEVIGDVTAPRVVISDGAVFKGHVDMAEPSGSRSSGAVEKSAPKPPPRPRR
ncbi:MAG: bactofilin family protein [Myxococcaceae bacterium]